jgi:hypothetical protein
MPNNENVRVQILINEDTVHGRFQDAVYFSLDEYNNLTEETFQSIKNARVDAWVTSVTENSQRDFVPSKEDLQSEKAELAARMTELDEQLKVTK